MENEIIIRAWRVTQGISFGAHIWFDPDVESVILLRVPSLDQRSHSDRLNEGVAMGDPESYLDKVGSVSGLENEDEAFV